MTPKMTILSGDPPKYNRPVVKDIFKMKKNTIMQKTLLILIALFALTCCNGKASNNKTTARKEAVNRTYSNNCFSINLPNGWEYDDSEWSGIDTVANTVVFYNNNDTANWIKIVRSALSLPMINTSEEAAQLTIALKEVPENYEHNGSKLNIPHDKNYIGVMDERDSVEIGGYPSYLVVFKYKLDNDTLVNMQFITLLPKEHRIYYINNNILKSAMRNGTTDALAGASIISTMRFKE